MYIYQVERDMLGKTLENYRGVFDGTVLDVGSGPGRKQEKLVAPSGKYMTLDINPEFKTDLVGSADQIPMPDASLDGIISTQVLGDLVYPHKAVMEFKRVLKPGGKVLVTEGFLNELHGEPRDFWRFTPHGLKAIFEDEGFSVKEVYKIGGFFSVTTQLVTRLLINSLSLYERKFFGRVASRVFWVAGKLAITLDSFLPQGANSKMGTDVVILAQKK